MYCTVLLQRQEHDTYVIQRSTQRGSALHRVPYLHSIAIFLEACLPAPAHTLVDNKYHISIYIILYIHFRILVLLAIATRGILYVSYKIINCQHAALNHDATQHTATQHTATQRNATQRTSLQTGPHRNTPHRKVPRSSEL